MNENDLLKGKANLKKGFGSILPEKFLKTCRRKRKLTKLAQTIPMMCCRKKSVPLNRNRLLCACST